MTPAAIHDRGDDLIEMLASLGTASSVGSTKQEHSEHNYQRERQMIFFFLSGLEHVR